jgi:hypothetical protein
MYGKVQIEYRLDKSLLLEIMEEWNRFLRRKVHLIACGGTAMTLLGIKPSTKDVDFMVPKDSEYYNLTKILKALGYKPETQSGWKRPGEKFQFDLFRGNLIHSTELLASPLEEGRHTLLKEYTQLYIGILNEHDLICSKLMRGTKVDYEDCLALAEARGSDLSFDLLTERFYEMIIYDVGEERLRPNITHFIELLREKGIL